MIDRLKPCPFCGGEAEIRGSLDSCTWIACQECRAETAAYSGEEDAIEAWNTRIGEQDND